MSIKINTVSLRESKTTNTELPSISVSKSDELSSPKINIISKSDVEIIPGPDKHTNDTSNDGHYNEFHFLTSIIIDNELY